MKSIVRTSFLLLALVSVGVVFSSTGCRKKADTLAVIRVRDANNSPVAGATVYLKFVSTGQGNVTPPTKPNMVGTSNDKGAAVFNFNEVYQLGQAGVAVMDIEAVYGDLSGAGIIKIEQEQTTTETVFI